MPGAPPLAIDLLNKLFKFDPESRLNAKQVLEHPFLADLYDPKEDVGCLSSQAIHYYDFEFENYQIEIDVMKELILDEIILANSKQAREYNR